LPTLVIDPYWSLGDVIMCTGLPEAFFKLYGEKTHIVNPKMIGLWQNNPYLSPEPIGQRFTVSPNTHKDYISYYPQRLFYNLTGQLVNKKDVSPRFYVNYNPVPGRIVINDAAGWPSRRGFNLDEVCNRLQDYEIVYLHNTFRDCFGQLLPPTITHYSEVKNDVDPIELLRTASLYIGFESGLTHLAAGVGVP